MLSSPPSAAAAAPSISNSSEDEIRVRKQQIRKQVRDRLKALTNEEIKRQSQQVWERLFALPVYQQAKSVGLFLSMPTGEIDTDPALENAVKSGKDIYVPQVGKNFEQADMDLLKVVAAVGGGGGGAFDKKEQDDGKLFHHSWPRNKWHIPEPPADMPLQKASPGDIDVLVVPGLAFDRNGDRLGQGKGYYDRFIERFTSSSSDDDDDDDDDGETKKTPALIAVALDCQLVPSIPVHDYDRRMDLVLLPSETIEPALLS